MWSNELQEQTREYFKSIPIAAMKRIDGSYGIATLKDGEYTIVDRKSNKIEIFQCIEDLIKSGWAID